MKIYQTKNNTSSNDYRLGSHPNYNTLIFEAPDRLFINGMGHDKDTLAPIFGSTFQVFASTAEWFKLTNAINFPQDSISDSSSLITSKIDGMKPNSDYIVTSNRQSIMAGVTISSIWRSTIDTNVIFFASTDPDLDRVWVGRYNISQANLDGFVDNVIGDGRTRGSTAFFHEDTSYLYGVLNGVNNTDSQSSSMFIRVNKGNLTAETSGYAPESDGTITILHVTDDYFVFMGADTGKGRTRYYGNTTSAENDQTIQIGIGLVRFSDEWTTNSVEHKLIEKIDDDADAADWHSPFLRVLGEDGVSRGSKLSGTIGGHGTINMSPVATASRNDPTLITYSHTLNNDISIYGDSDGDYYSVDSTDFFLVSPAIVSNSTLINTHKIIRTYVFLRTSDAEYVIIRNNTPLPENTNAFQTSASHAGGGSYGSSTNPDMDQRKCTITPKTASLPSTFTDSNITGSSGFFSKASDQDESKKWHNMTYFEDGSNGYLMVDFAHPCIETNPTTSAFHSIWVFKITNHSNSITNDPGEINSIDLELIQDIEIDDTSYGLYRPTDDPKTFIAMSISTSVHPVYSWNSSTEQFTTSYSLNGNICSIGNDSNGNVYSAHKSPYGRFEIHAESIVLPNEITVVPAQTRYEYTGTTINSTVSVDAYNYLGNRIAATINLQILGSGVEFSSSGSPTNNGKSISVTTNTSSSTAVDIDITSSSFVRITASMSV